METTRVLSPPRRSSILSQVQTPYSARVFARILVALFGFCFIFLFAPWQQTITGNGRVVAYAPLDRQQFIEAPIDGRIVHWNVVEGSTVKKDDLVVEISDNDPMFLDRLKEEKEAVELRIASIQARIESIKARIKSLEASAKSGVSAASSRTRIAGDRLDASEHAVEAAQAVLTTAQLNLNRQKALYEQGLASQRALETAVMDEARARTDYNRAKAALSGAKSEVLAIRSDEFKVGSDGSAMIEDAKAALGAGNAELANAQAELPRISARLSRQHSQSVKAPRDGTIMRLIVSQDGEMVKTGEPLAVLIPETNQRAVELFVDGNDLPLISENREARIQFQGWPVVQFSGIPELSFGTFAGHVFMVDATDNGSGKFRVLIKPDGIKGWPDAKFLRQGVRAQGWIFLNRVTVGYELWRKFNDFPPSIPYEPLKNKEGKEGKSK
ncbi:MAG: HlyD family efflux transporter periplasmic adaptor subunit [Leptospiraceae bacterium]|nr:HlyD family efflux transporter periplasmic adaptor subunit [Leptospiraceae bacterium]